MEKIWKTKHRRRVEKMELGFQAMGQLTTSQHFPGLMKTEDPHIQDAG